MLAQVINVEPPPAWPLWEDIPAGVRTTKRTMFEGHEYHLSMASPYKDYPSLSLHRFTRDADKDSAYLAIAHVIIDEEMSDKCLEKFNDIMQRLDAYVVASLL